MSLQSEIKTFLATALTDAATAEKDVASVLANPAIAAFVPIFEQEIKTQLTSYGIPVSDVIDLGEALLAALNKLAAQAATTQPAAASVTSGATILGLLTAFLLLTSLTACSNQASYASAVADIQHGYQAAEILVNTEILAGNIPPATAAKIQAIEAKSDPLVTSLSTTTNPTTIGSVLTDMETIAQALPTGQITNDAQQAIAAAELGWTLVQGSAAKTN